MIGLTACSPTELAVRQTITLLVRAKPAMQAESDVEMVLRAVPAGLKQLEGFALIIEDRRLTTMLAEAFCGYGGLLQDEWEAADLAGEDARAGELRTHALAMLDRCAGYALALIGPRWRALVEPDTDDDAAAALLATARPADLDGLYWLGTAAATSLGIAPDQPHLVDLLPRVQQIMERIVELDDDYALGGAHLNLGILYSAQSAAVGGDPELGAEHFERAIAIGGGKLLLPMVLYARVHAVTTRDPDAFDARLRAVLRTSPAVFPEQRLTNEIAHRKARRYQRHRDRWFE